MRNRKLSLLLAAALCAVFAAQSKADNGSYTYSGGAFSTGAKVGQNIVVSGAPLSAAGATLTFSCPITSYGGGAYQLNWKCAGGTVTIATADKSVVFTGTFDAGTMSFSGSGGGRGGHVTYWYSFYGSFSGTITAGGVTQAANGSVSQSVKTSSQLGSGSAPVSGGSLGWSSAYGPLLVADNGNSRIVAADSITGANLTMYGKAGNGTGEFGTIAGLTQDAQGRIYATDSSLNRLVRIDNLAGLNWVELGSTGTGNNHFNSPKGVTVDAAGKIWVADAGNNRIVRIDDMTGKNWMSFGTAGSGTNQFVTPSAIAFDALGRIYVADAGNNRLVRFDDLTGKNWVSLTEVLSGPYGYLVTAPTGVEVDAAGNIYIATGGTYGYLMKVSDMTGAGPVLSSWSNPLTSISRDRAGTIYVASGLAPGLAEVVDAAATGYFASALGGAVQSPSVVYASLTASPTPADAVLSLSALDFGSRNVGEPSAAQTVSLTNLGADALTISSILASADYKVTSNCPGVLTGGVSCTVSVKFDPTQTGVRPSALTVESNGVHPAVSLAMTGTGTVPKVVVLPGSLKFDAQLTGSSSSAQLATLSNTGTGPLTIASIVATGDFSQSNNCGAVLQPGTGCSIEVVFHPAAAGARGGAVTISDDAVAAGTNQTVTLTGTGSASAPAFTLTPESLAFPDELVNTVSAAQTVTLKNSSAAAVALTAPSYPAGFQVKTTCGATLAKGASCSFSAAFAPTVAGAVSGVVSIPITGQPTLTVGLSGTGTPAGHGPALAANPAAVNFGQQVYNDSGSMSVTITNTAGVPTAIRAHSFAGASAFTLTGYTCPAILAGGASCTAQITFSPVTTSPLNNSATLTITEGSGAQTQIAISGQAVSDSGN